MSDQWGTREHTPDRHPPTERRRVPSTAAAQQAYIALGAVALTTATLSCFFERIGAIEIGRGVYAILVGLFVVGGCGLAVCRSEARIRRYLADRVDDAETRVRQELGGKVAELTTVLAELCDEVTRQRTVYLPAQAKQADGAVPAPRRPAVDPEELREEIERVVAEELATREAVRSQGYAEGYVDGFGRRGDDDVPPPG